MIYILHYNSSFLFNAFYSNCLKCNNIFLITGRQLECKLLQRFIFRSLNWRLFNNSWITQRIKDFQSFFLPFFYSCFFSLYLCFSLSLSSRDLFATVLRINLRSPEMVFYFCIRHAVNVGVNVGLDVSGWIYECHKESSNKRRFFRFQ